MKHRPISQLSRFVLLAAAGLLLAAACDKSSDTDDSAASTSSSGGRLINLDDEEPLPEAPFSTSCDLRPPPNSMGRDLPELLQGGQGGGGGDPGLEQSVRCGCDGTYYPSEEAARDSGAALSPFTHCTLDEAHFGCGDKACLVGSEGCGAVITHARCCDEQGFACFSLPEPCADLAPDDSPCACFREFYGQSYYGTCTEVATSEGWATYHTIFDGL